MSSEIPEPNNSEIETGPEVLSFYFENTPSFIALVQEWSAALGVDEGEFMVRAVDFHMTRIAAVNGDGYVECFNPVTQDREHFNVAAKWYEFDWEEDDAREKIKIEIEVEQMQTLMLGAAYKYADTRHVKDGCTEWEDQRMLIGGIITSSAKGYIQRLGMEEDGWTLRINGNLSEESHIQIEPVMEARYGGE